MILLASSMQMISAELKLMLTIVPRIRNCAHKGIAALGLRIGEESDKEDCDFWIEYFNCRGFKEGFYVCLFSNLWQVLI